MAFFSWQEKTAMILQSNSFIELMLIGNTTVVLSNMSNPEVCQSWSSNLTWQTHDTHDSWFNKRSLGFWTKNDLDVPNISPTMMLKENGNRDIVDIVPNPNLFTDP